MAYFNAKFERERKQRDNNPQRIAMLAKQKGRFEVSLRWRDDGLRRVCQRMVKRGELRGGRRERDRLVFYPVEMVPLTGVEPALA